MNTTGTRMNAPIGYSVNDGIAEIVLDRPPVNALDATMLDGLLAALRRAGDDASARVVVLRSAVPGRFCAGLDLPVFRDTPPARARELVDKLYAQLWDVQFNLGKPSIAAITGAVRGGGMTVAVSFDMLVAADDSTFGYPELDVGLLPAIHYTHLPRLIGRHRAFDLLFTGRSFGAAEAASLGLINRVVPASDVHAEALRVAAALAAKSPELVRLGKKAFMHAVDADYRRGIAGAVDLVAATIATDDSREALDAFAQKRKPVWGRGS